MGIGNRSVTIVGKRRITNQWIHRESLHPRMKKMAYKAMDMKHFAWVHRNPSKEWNISCHEHLYNQYVLNN